RGTVAWSGRPMGNLAPSVAYPLRRSAWRVCSILLLLTALGPLFNCPSPLEGVSTILSLSYLFFYFNSALDMRLPPATGGPGTSWGQPDRTCRATFRTRARPFVPGQRSGTGESALRLSAQASGSGTQRGSVWPAGGM